MTTPEFQVAEDAARLGGAIVARYFREGVTMRSKDVGNLVSDADVEAERAIIAEIRRAFPGHSVLAEEEHSGDAAGAEHLWVIDPLDGTNNFAHKIPHIAVSIAYYHKGVPTCGIVYNPLDETWYTTIRGQGARHNGKLVHVGEEDRLEDIVVGTGFGYDRGALMEATLASIADLSRRGIHGVRRFGAAALDLCWVGTGIFGAFYEYTLQPWDFAAGRLFVEEAGGRVTTCQNKSLPMAPSSILATNGLVHEAMHDVLRIHWPD
jgi:myo-inositol-1(or 4)-monophosphatase